jgi:NADH-quinone oxidoreductase subunit L
MHIMIEWMISSLIFLPALAVASLVTCVWLKLRPSEATINRIVAGAFGANALLCIGTGIWLLAHDRFSYTVSLGNFFVAEHYAFEWTLVVDGLSVTFVTLTSFLVGLIGVFSRRYLHRESGYLRFFFLLCLFGTGTTHVALAGSLDLIFFGWEIVGFTSTLLIAFFYERKKPIEHGLRAFITYRMCDMGLLAAAVWMHHTVGSSDMVQLGDDTAWYAFNLPADLTNTTIIGFLLLWAAMGKSAQIPFGGWLPRAMEGPTPSSAIFYGAISIHLGPYLLLRAAPFWNTSGVASTAVVAIGVLTAIHATFVGRVQTDIKSTLAYASMAQVGIIFAEIGLGFSTLALLHIVSHAVVRSLQILRSPGLLADYGKLERVMKHQLPRTGGHLEFLAPASMRPWLYRHALERGYFDAILRDYVVGGFLGFVRKIDAVDRRWATWAGGVGSQRKETKVTNEGAP